MNASTFEFSFTFQGKKMYATCQKFEVHNYSQIRVAIQKESQGEEVFIFYEINSPKQKYFWFELTVIKEEIAKTISKKLIGIQAYSN